MGRELSCHAIDFGTSNSLIAHIANKKHYELVPLEKSGELMMKSLIFTPQSNLYYFGQEAIHQFQEYAGEGRLFKSIKKFLPVPSYTGTMVHDKKFKIEEIIATILRSLRERAMAREGQEVHRVVLGRPALYSLNKDEDQMAQDRMHKAAQLAGYQEILFCPEPLAAGLDYKSEKQGDKIVLIADFGGGTSDFTLLKMHPGKYSSNDILGLAGVFLAGDAFDGALMRHSISHHFGKDIKYRLPMGNNIIQFPRLFLNKLCSPAHIAHLKDRETWEFLKEIRTWVVADSDKRIIDQLFSLVEHQLGYPLYQNIEKSKIELGTSHQSIFSFDGPSICIRETMTREKFKEDSQDIVDRIIAAMMDVFTQSGLKIDDVDEICLTGGSAQSPLLQDRLQQIFPKEKLRQHKIYQSVVEGLAKYAQETMF